MIRILKTILIIALVALVVIQFIPMDKNEQGYASIETFELETRPSPEVAALLKTNCYDCHSDQTEYPWYSQIAPVSFWLDDHIRDGKKHFNVSEWASYSTKKKDHKLDELIEEVKEGEMPLDSYTWVHGGLSEEQQQLLVQWATLARMQFQEKAE